MAKGEKTKLTEKEYERVRYWNNVINERENELKRLVVSLNDARQALVDLVYVKTGKDIQQYEFGLDAETKELILTSRQGDDSKNV